MYSAFKQAMVNASVALLHGKSHKFDFLHLNIFYVLNDQYKLPAEILNVLVTPSSISNLYSVYTIIY